MNEITLTDEDFIDSWRYKEFGEETIEFIRWD